MGVELYVILQKTIPTTGDYAETKALVWALPNLDLMAQKLGVTPMSMYMPVTAKDIEFLRSRGIPCNEKPRGGWHAASEGLRTVRAMIKELNPKKKDIEHRHVLDGLKYVEQQLTIADEHGVQFYFLAQ